MNNTAKIFSGYLVGSRATICRGLTLLELLMSLTILSGLVAVTIPWLKTTAQWQATLAPRQTWTVSAERFMQMLRDDLALGDFAVTDNSRSADNKTSSRIIIKNAGQTLQVRTRLHPGVDSPVPSQSVGGPIIREYDFNASSQTIQMQLYQLDPQDARQVGRPIGGKRLILDRVTAWECQIEILQTSDHDTARNARANNLPTVLHLVIAGAENYPRISERFIINSP